MNFSRFLIIRCYVTNSRDNTEHLLLLKTVRYSRKLIATVLKNLKPFETRIYFSNLLVLLYLTFSFLFSFSGFNAIPGLSTVDYVTVAVIEKYLDFKVKKKIAQLSTLKMMLHRTIDDSQRRFLAQHDVAMLDQCCN